MTARHYRGLTGARRVIAVTAGSALEDLVASSGGYELLDEDGPAADGGDEVPPVGEQPSPAGDGPAPLDTLPPVPPAAPAAAETPAPAPADPTLAAILAQAYEVDTAEAVNAWLDEHPYAAEAVLEAERAGKARKGILEGRHTGTVPAAAPATA